MNGSVRSKRTTQGQLSPTDLVYLILGLTFHNNKLPSISRDAIYIGFKKLSEEYPQYFRDFYFITRGGVPHSRE